MCVWMTLARIMHCTAEFALPSGCICTEARAHTRTHTIRMWISFPHFRHTSGYRLQESDVLWMLIARHPNTLSTTFNSSTQLYPTNCAIHCWIWAGAFWAFVVKVDQEYSEIDRIILHIKLSCHEKYWIGIVYNYKRRQSYYLHSFSMCYDTMSCMLLYYICTRVMHFQVLFILFVIWFWVLIFILSLYIYFHF